MKGRALAGFYLLWRTRNGQRQWSGPYWQEDQAQAAAEMNRHCREGGYIITGTGAMGYDAGEETS